MEAVSGAVQTNEVRKYSDKGHNNHVDAHGICLSLSAVEAKRWKSVPCRKSAGYCIGDYWSMLQHCYGFTDTNLTPILYQSNYEIVTRRIIHEALLGNLQDFVRSRDDIRFLVVIFT